MRNVFFVIRTLILLTIFFRVLVTEKHVQAAPYRSCLLVEARSGTVRLDLTSSIISYTNIRDSYEFSCKQAMISKKYIDPTDCWAYTGETVKGVYYWDGKKYETSWRGTISYTGSYHKPYSNGYYLVAAQCSISGY
jgi:hypothetical protein